MKIELALAAVAAVLFALKALIGSRGSASAPERGDSGQLESDLDQVSREAERDLAGDRAALRRKALQWLRERLGGPPR